MFCGIRINLTTLDVGIAAGRSGREELANLKNAETVSAKKTSFEMAGHYHLYQVCQLSSNLGCVF